MSARIPLTIRLDGSTFTALERIAEAKGTDVRTLVASHLTASLNPEPYRSVRTRSGKPVSTGDVDAWVQAARMGVTNEAIAERYGVTRQLVSRCLIDRGIRRQRPRPPKEQGS